MNNNEKYTAGLINPTEITGDTIDDNITEEDIAEESTLSYSEGFEDGLELNKDILSKEDDIVITKIENTRSKLALLFTLATFSIFIFGMVIAVVDGIVNKTSIVTNLKEIISTISGVFLGSLGFVLGYYFRKGDN